MLSHPSLGFAGQAILLTLSVVAAVIDIRSRRVPNWLVSCGIVAGFSLNCGLYGMQGLLTAAAGFGLGFILYFPLYLLRARGAGDVKLLAAMGSITGAGNCLWIFLLTAILGGIIALALVISRARLRTTLVNVAAILHDLIRLRAPWRSDAQLDVTSTKAVRLPHAVALLAGTLAFLLLIHH